MKRVFAALLIFSIIISQIIPVLADEKIFGVTVSKGGTDSSVTIDSEESYSGESSLKVTNRSFEQANRFLSLTIEIPVEKGAEYEYGFYAKAQKAAKQSVMIDWGTRHSLAPLSTSYEWTKFKYSYEHTSSAASAVIRFVFDSTVDGFWIDDLYCYKIENGEPIGENLVPNSGFEQFGSKAETIDENGTLPVSVYYDNIADEKYVPIYKLDNVSIDGSYEEWEKISKTVLYETLVYAAGKGKPADLEVWYKCAYDDERFYFVAETTDDIYNSFGGDTYWSGDCIQLAISSLS